jgi:hypothetical protein
MRDDGGVGGCERDAIGGDARQHPLRHRQVVTKIPKQLSILLENDCFPPRISQ